MSAPTHVNVIFDGPPGPVAGRFVECENDAGMSFNAGEWSELPNGLWKLRIALTPSPSAVGGVPDAPFPRWSKEAEFFAATPDPGAAPFLRSPAAVAVRPLVWHPFGPDAAGGYVSGKYRVCVASQTQWAATHEGVTLGLYATHEGAKIACNNHYATYVRSLLVAADAPAPEPVGFAIRGDVEKSFRDGGIMFVVTSEWEAGRDVALYTRPDLSPPPAPKVGDGFVPDGWKLVPLRPTEEMSDAGLESPPCLPHEGGPRYRYVDDCYMAMIAAAPMPPALAAAPAPVETDPCNEMLGLSEQNGWGTRDADDRAWVLSRFREWDSASLFPASDRPIAIRLAIRLLTLKEDEVEQPWNDVDRTLPPSGVFVETMRTGERLPNVCAWKWARIGTDVEWYERGKPGDPGRTTITHSTFVPPTHWRPIRTGSAS